MDEVPPIQLPPARRALADRLPVCCLSGTEDSVLDRGEVGMVKLTVAQRGLAARAGAEGHAAGMGGAQSRRSCRGGSRLTTALRWVGRGATEVRAPRDSLTPQKEPIDTDYSERDSTIAFRSCMLPGRAHGMTGNEAVPSAGDPESQGMAARWRTTRPRPPQNCASCFAQARRVIPWQ